MGGAGGNAKPVRARSAVPAAVFMFLTLFVAFLPGAGAARLVGQAAGTGPAVPVVACASSYGDGPPTGLAVLPRSLRPGLPAGVAKMLAYYTNDRRTLDPVLAPRGWDCHVQVGADGTTGVDVYPPRMSPKPGGTGDEEVQAASGSACQGCTYSTVCALVPAAGNELGFAMLPCAPLKRGESVTWILGVGQRQSGPHPRRHRLRRAGPRPDPRDRALRLQEGPRRRGLGGHLYPALGPARPVHRHPRRLCRP